ncbi:tail fiber protein [Salmonella enterica]|nr:tail fiber protein [Salmonella enterica]EIN4172379.1 tail fiber protein [Salmonella enterica subsp. enterica serovar Derby]EKQ7594308.1 tail fiber protein [Salmonella enterica subsp. enterica serovar Senftenberg]EMC5004551.1 tail fiber protein [Salmonella enterica]MCR2255039.1 tail fiber protein [Salmonella enterica]HBM1622948.1 tail fiber protein [Salmonella enterica subsp. enterica]
MNDVTVVTSVTYPSPESLALVADVQYHEPYLSAALNRKFRGIVDPGFYAGFLPKPGGGMNLLITSVDGDKTAGAASVDIGEFYQVTIQHRKDISLALNAGKKYAIVLKGRYLLGEDTYQVNTASHIHAAEFVARTYTDSYQLGDGELLVCTVNIPAGVSTITQEMIDTSERINRTIGIDISDSVTSTRSDVAASSLAVKKAYDLAKSKYTAQDASTTQKGLVQLSSETNSDSETMAATPKAVKSVKDLADTKAPIESPSLTGTPTAPTAAQGTNNTQIATTAYVRAAISALVGSSPEALDTLNELAEALGNDPNFATTMTNALAGKQPLDATLTALAGLPTGANKLPYFTGKDTVAQTDLTPVGRDILAKSSTQAIIQYLGLGETINLAAGALQKSQNGGDIPDKKQFARTIGAVTSTTITLGESGWFKIATVVMPQATSTAVIKLYGGAGFNAGSPEQAAISELVLRAGNGSPVGITATLWRRSPAAANEVAWVNTSGDTYDIYINIGQYAYWLIAQYDYTGNANVTLHSTPEYSSVQPGNSTSGQTYTIYSSLMKPTAGDVGALPITGGQLNGPLSIGTDNALGGNSIVLGDNDTGFKQNGDGILDTYANNQHTVRVAPGEMMVLGAIRAGKEKKLSLTSNNNSTMTATFNLWGDANRPTVIELDDDQGWQLYSQRNPDGSVLFTVNGDITANVLRAGGAIYQNNGDIFGSLWGNGWLSTWINNNLVLDVQLGAGTSVTTWNNAGSWPNTPGYVVTSVWKDYQGENIDGINYAPLQKRVGNQWYTVQGGTV